METWFEARWYASRAPWYLLPLSALFGAAVAVRRALYARGLLRSRRVAARVVVVGNVTVGGSGKTPLVAWLARRLEAEGIAVGIVTRGYGGENRIPYLVGANSVNAGDEARWMAVETGVPVVVGRDRAAAAQFLAGTLASSIPKCESVPSSSPSLTGENRGVDGNRPPRPIILADDGLQHYRLARDVEIVAVDGARGFGNGALLPAGPLRERPARIAEVDAVVVKGETGPLLPPDVLVFRVRHTIANAVPLAGGAPVPLGEFRGRTVAALAGIADPENFFRALEAEGLRLERCPLPDHADRDRIAGLLAALGDERPILMTDKDAAKLEVPPANAFRVPLALALTQADAAGLLALVRGAPLDFAKEED